MRARLPRDRAARDGGRQEWGLGEEQQASDAAPRAASIRSPLARRIVVTTAATAWPAVIPASAEENPAVRERRPWTWPCRVAGASVPTAAKAVCSISCATATVPASRGREGRRPMRATAIGVARTATASRSQKGGAPPPESVCAAPATIVATNAAADPRSTRSRRARIRSFCTPEAYPPIRAAPAGPIPSVGR